MESEPQCEHLLWDLAACCNLDEAVTHAVAVVREVRPQVVVTYDENGGYGHPDHIQAHRVAMAAVDVEPTGDDRTFWVTDAPESAAAIEAGLAL